MVIRLVIGSIFPQCYVLQSDISTEVLHSIMSRHGCASTVIAEHVILESIFLSHRSCHFNQDVYLAASCLLQYTERLFLIIVVLLCF